MVLRYCWKHHSRKVIISCKVMESFEILCGIAVLFLAIYYYFISTYDFWKSRDICGPQPILGFGNFKDVMLNKKFIGDYLREVYNKYKDESMIGIFTSRTPILIIKSPELIKDILIKDFSKFANRGVAFSEKDSLSQHLFSLESKRWRPLRTRLSPVFTSGKLKDMFSLISECADNLVQYTEKLVSKNEPIECRELTAKYTTDVIGTCAFGIEMNALSDEDSEFRRMGRLIFAPNWKNNIRFKVSRFLPWLYEIVHYILPKSEVTTFFIRAVVETMDYREKNKVNRNDFIDVLRELKRNPDKVGNIKFTESLIASQAFVFFFAGFETSSTTMSHALYELALNQQIQNKLQEEIDEEYTKHGSNLTYENVKNMNYLDKVFKETLRKYPPLSFLMRQSTTSYTFDSTKLNISEGQKVLIPVFAIHRDPDIYPKPDVFDPERFSDETVKTRNAMHYLPFGDGPRNCIGARFAIFQTKIGLIKILRNYKVETCEKTQIPYVIDPKAFLLAPKDGIHLRIINQTYCGYISCAVTNYVTIALKVIVSCKTMEYFEILCGIAAVFLAAYYYLTSTYDFWKSRDIRGPQPMPGFGNFKDVMLNKKFVGDYLREVYNKYKDESMIGIFARKTPILIVKDPELIKDILIKDFSKFADRGIPVSSEKADPLSQHLFSLESKRWRPLRTNLSPVFTSGKLKEMFSLISECADNFVQYTEKLVSRNEPIECRELTAKYTTDVIGTCAFGIEMNALSDEDSEFRKMGRLVFTPNWKSILRMRVRQSLPWFYEILSYILPKSEVATFFTRVVVETMDYREMNNVNRNDFIDMLRELKRNPDKVGNFKLTENLIASQAFVFFLAGFETSSTTISHALYELALNPQIQDKLREEIDEEYTKHGSNLTYENVKNMNYLDKVFKETLRKYPPGTILMRQSTTSYTFDDTKLNIPEGQKVWIPVLAIHRDPGIYPKPDVFDPERFSDKTLKTRHAMHYLPFGDGPRNCIGARFAIFQTKIGLIKILRNYKVETCEKTQIPYVIDPKAFLLAPKDGIHLRIIKINRT
ncbi:uncharacterized protein [Anoplolepis gracilipes]|uniref:uncharacterized protein n=1 Tax=Anoplolepis gracilipes TaxID=354296 RepID=UPI003BA340CA